MDHTLIRQRLLADTRSEGVTPVAARLGISRLGLLAYLADVPRNPGTDALIAVKCPEPQQVKPQRRAG
jgi:hypothetical protein